MPDPVEMPAPVRTMMRCASRSIAAIASTSDTAPSDIERSVASGASGGGRAARRRPVGWGTGRISMWCAWSGAGLRGVLECFAVAFVRPARALVAHRRVEPHRVEHTLDVVGVVTLFEQRERDATRVATSGL